MTGDPEDPARPGAAAREAAVGSADPLRGDLAEVTADSVEVPADLAVAAMWAAASAEDSPAVAAAADKHF